MDGGVAAQRRCCSTQRANPETQARGPLSQLATWSLRSRWTAVYTHMRREGLGPSRIIPPPPPVRVSRTFPFPLRSEGRVSRLVCRAVVALAIEYRRGYRRRVSPYRNDTKSQTRSRFRQQGSSCGPRAGCEFDCTRCSNCIQPATGTNMFTAAPVFPRKRAATFNPPAQTGVLGGLGPL